MPFKSIFAAAIVCMTLAGCTTSAANNTTYALPADTGGGVRIPIN
ncbi:hypothetical protein OCK02_25180 [Rhizobium sp. TRM96647]|nr:MULTISPECIES: hypothetical protein [unclassified Rhizobium]MCV3739438.1 hypothetical protein [Rhizobium sp. TRM96647]MCV3761100.1 hypothetical protein [Rhizobium sp. TRM96650]